MTGLSAGAVAVLANSLQAQTVEDAASHTAHNAYDEGRQACAKACSDCQRECDMCGAHCAQMLKDGNKEHATTLATCQDCADFCVAAAQIVSRGGPFSKEICKSCAQACAMCGEACEKFPDDKHMKMCAEECRRCEKACRDMVDAV